MRREHDHRGRWDGCAAAGYLLKADEKWLDIFVPMKGVTLPAPQQIKTQTNAASQLSRASASPPPRAQAKHLPRTQVTYQA